jgi:STE24 endopeptidase
VNEDKSARYHRLKRRAGLASGLATIVVLGGFLLTGASAALASAARAISPSPVASIALYVLGLGVVIETTAFPLALYRNFFLERHYGLFSGVFGGWIRDYLKALGVGLLLGTAAAEAVYFLLARFPSLWWLISAALFVAAIALMANLAPTLLLPMFYKFRPLERESLRSRLVDLSARAGVPVLGIYEWAMGEKTRTANAALVGTGRTRRIILSDTLLAAYTEEEIEVVMAHELGHHVHRDILTALVVQSVLVLAGFFCAALVLNASWRSLGLRSPADVAGLPLLLLAGGGIMRAATPLVNGLSRRNERRADGYALTMTAQPAAFISAMKRLGAQNLAEENPSRAVLWLFHSHPPVAQRIEAARQHLNIQGATCDAQPVEPLH